MARRRKWGKCRICLQDGSLSWEHVPPAAAFNRQPVVRAVREQLVSDGLWDGKRGEISQRGCGAHTLCEKCNNDTGAWYGPEFAIWARQGADYLQVIPGEQVERYCQELWIGDRRAA